MSLRIPDWEGAGHALQKKPWEVVFGYFLLVMSLMACGHSPLVIF